MERGWAWEHSHDPPEVRFAEEKLFPLRLFGSIHPPCVREELLCCADVVVPPSVLCCVVFVCRCREECDELPILVGGLPPF
jgi:hypothetical protein